MSSLLKRLFAGNSTRFSFLTVSLYGTGEKKLKAVVRRLPRCYFLTDSLYVSAACIFKSDNCHVSNF